MTRSVLLPLPFVSASLMGIRGNTRPRLDKTWVLNHILVSHGLCDSAGRHTGGVRFDMGSLLRARQPQVERHRGAHSGSPSAMARRSVLIRAPSVQTGQG